MINSQTNPTDVSQSGFLAFAQAHLAVVLDKLQAKGRAYTEARTDSAPAWANILAMAHLTGVTPYQAVLVLQSKHLYALSQWAQGLDLPDAADRLDDVLIYCLLLQFMAQHLAPPVAPGAAEPAATDRVPRRWSHATIS